MPPATMHFAKTMKVKAAGAGPDRPLRLLVVTSPPPAKRLPELFLSLLDAQVELLFAVPAKALPEAVRKHPGVATVDLPFEREDPVARAVWLLRAAADLVRFLSPDLRHAAWPRRRSLRRVLQLAGLPRTRQAARELAGLELRSDLCARLAGAFRDVERLIPPPPALTEAVGRLDVDGVLLISRCLLGGNDPDVLKAARQAGLPSVMLVWSWDNLSSKATLHEHPDRLLVWNDLQAREAVEQHGVASERVTVVGAANFDRFFEEVRENDGQRTPSADGEQATLLYLGSSPKVASRESVIFERWLGAIRASDDPALREARVVLRPHPAAVRKWVGWTAPDDGVVVVDPGAKTEPAKLSRLLQEADAVVALNTSAEIEAAIAGQPVLTFRAGSDARGQEGSAHFPYLLEANGGFVLDAATLDEHVSRLESVLRGDYDPERVPEFLERFVRPAGLSLPVVPLLTSAIVDGIRLPRRVPRVERPGGPNVPAASGLRLLVVATPLLVGRFPDLLLRLLDSGAELVFAVPVSSLPAEVADHPLASTVELPLTRSGAEAESVALFRSAGDVVRFMSPPLQHAHWPRKRALHRLLLLAGQPWTRALARTLGDLRFPSEVCTELTDAFRLVERLLPPEEALEREIGRVRADAMLVITRCALGGVEPDAIKAARRLSLPSIALVCSWDNLSAKATLTEHPDRLLVWNETQVQEAIEFHGVDRDRVVALGAANFDRFFDQLADHQEPQPRRTGDRATVLYLGSSTKVAPDEPAIFDRWLAAVRSSGDPVVRDAVVVVRPHPSAVRRWQRWTPANDRVSYVEPGARIEPGVLARLLGNADAVVALNTSAELEAAIAGRPVLTFRAQSKARGQEGSAHFRYLLETSGGFVIDAPTLAEHTSALGDVLRGEYDADAMRQFVERFVRPAGLGQPVVPLVADWILDFAAAEGRGPEAVLHAESRDYHLDVGA
jgi:hypothetical protein